jgi:uncharacterized membrane protein YdjX (TVP38/TMEM64 family)
MKIKKLSKKQLFSLVLTVSTILLFGGFLTFLIRTIGANELREIVQQAGVFGPIIFILIHAITIMVTPGGGGVVLILFDFWPGLFYSILSAIIGSSANFWIARKFGKKLVGRVVSLQTLAKLDPITKRVNSGSPLLLVPIFSTSAFNLSCYAIGLTKIKYSKFVSAVLISSAINAPIYVATGSSLIQGQSFWQYLTLPSVLVLAILTYFVEEKLKKKWKKKS